MKKEIIHPHLIRLILTDDEVAREKLIPGNDLNEFRIRPDRLYSICQDIGIDVKAIKEMQVYSVVSGLIIEVKLRSQSSDIRRVFCSTNIDHFYTFLDQQRINGTLLYKNGNYIFLPGKNIPEALAVEYFLEPGVIEIPIRDVKVITTNALQDLIRTI